MDKKSKNGKRGRNKKPIIDTMLVMDLPSYYRQSQTKDWFTPMHAAIACRSCEKLTIIEPEYWDNKSCPNCHTPIISGE